MSQTTTTAVDLCGHLKGDCVSVEFADGGEPETGILVDAKWSFVEVRQTDGAHEWTRRFSLRGDADTPRVTAVRIVPVQTDGLF